MNCAIYHQTAFFSCSQQHGFLPAPLRRANMSGKAGGEGLAMEREREERNIQDSGNEWGAKVHFEQFFLKENEFHYGRER